MGMEERFTGEESGARGEDGGVHDGAWRRGFKEGFFGGAVRVERHFKSEDFESEKEDSEFR